MLTELMRHPVLAARAIARRASEIPSKGLPGCDAAAWMTNLTGSTE
jgi:hypothetical protein